MLSDVWDARVNIATVITLSLSLCFCVYKLITYRIKFKFTYRGKIYCISSELIYFLHIVFLYANIENKIINLLINCVINIAYPLIYKVVEYVLNIYFERKNAKFVELQSRKLKELNPIVIGITGSYGKTSCKKILECLLEDDFDVISTDKNFNTPMGIAMTVTKLKPDNQVLIAEMGARKAGDIDELCRLFPPKYAIITGVCDQHIETFGSVESIANEKYKLAEATAKQDGLCVFNTNDKLVFRMFKSHKGKKISASNSKKSNFHAGGIRLSDKGSTFDLHVGDKVYLCKTNLLGRHNVQNIVMCVALAVELGCNIDKLVKKIEKLPQIKHRLEYMNSNGVHILDDGYNGNIKGVLSSFECMTFFPHKRVAVLQGVVELGKKTEEINIKIGEMAAKIADTVVLLGINGKYIEKGLNNAYFQGKIIKLKSFRQLNDTIKKEVKRGDTLLLQNDVPDVY